ncbi:PAS domain S-box protein [Deinococcus roseus]|uniref:histidine kinase n=1 Tax=Deinococcus roseus TaxID=392414 RepID=A0ABQ2DDD2_9DEIO|nr:PAS domain S-box protein [Deinococcus roseus]GGJ52722.1 hypothetical protein GCM10008938_43330 [Deinococcus roseus]
MPASITRVLIVEDSPEDAEILRHHLKRSVSPDLKVVSAQTGAQGLQEMAGPNPPQLVFLDLSLPDMDGMEVLHALQALKDSPTVIVITGSGNESTAVKAIKSGAADYLIKSALSGQRVQQAVHHAQEQRRLQTELHFAQDQMASMVQQAPIGMALLDRDLCFTQANQAFMDLTRQTQLPVGTPLRSIQQPVVQQLLPLAEQVLGGGMFKAHALTTFDQNEVRHHLVHAYPAAHHQGVVRWVGLTVEDVTEHQNTATLLKENQKKLNLLLSSTNIGTWEWPINEHQTQNFEEHHSLLGEITEVMEGKAHFTKFLHPEDKTQVLEKLDRYLQQPEHFSFETRIVTHGGDTRWMLVRRAPDSPEGMLSGAIIDITELKTIEETLRESQHFLARITNTTPTVLYLTDLHLRRVIYANTQFEDMLGYRPEEILQMDAGQLDHLVLPADLQLTPLHHPQIEGLNDGDILGTEHRILRKNGLWRWWSSRNTVFARDAQQHPTVVLTCAVDITERKTAEEKRREAEQTLQESEHRFQLMADQAPVLIVMTDEEKHGVFLNHAWMVFTGHAGPGTASTWLEPIDPEDRPRVEQVFRQAHLQRKGFEVEYRLKNHDGEHCWMFHRAVPRFTPEGEFKGFIAAVIDVHTRKLAEKGLQENEQRMRDLMDVQKRFVADAAHELRNPLTSIQGNMDLMVRHRVLAEQDRSEIISDVQREAARLGRLVNDMLQLARGDGGAEIREDEVELHELLQDVWQDFVRLHKNHHFRLGTLQPALVLGDHDRLKQLAIILLENAVKYTLHGGQITLSLKQQGDTVVWNIADSGVGIAEEHQERVFERFFRVDPSRQSTGNPGGTGLGLSIARWIVEKHGGKVSLTSVLGEGTTVTVELPVFTLEEQNA